MSQDADAKGPGVKIPPPLIFLLSILLALGIEARLPMKISSSVILEYAGALVILVSLALIIAVFISFRRSRTHIEPWKPTSTLVTTGIFAFSRNPIYLGFCLITLGLGLVINSLWVVISFLPAAWLTVRFVIKKEEDYLTRKFGLDYEQYRSTVRRWI